MLSLFNQLRWWYSFQSRSTHTFNSAANLARRRGGVQCFLSMLFSGCRHPYPISRWNQNETPWSLSSTCTDVQSVGSRWDSKHARRVRPWPSSQRLSSASALSEFLLPLDFTPLSPLPRFPLLCRNQTPPPLLRHAPVSLIY